MRMKKKRKMKMSDSVIKNDNIFPVELTSETEDENNFINVLDKGYVRLVDSMGSDLSVVNAARASFGKEVSELGTRDARLIDFLVRENHMSPFRHAFMTFEFKAPLMVARQHWKYVVGSDHTMDSWNESSRRYITMEPEFYYPNAEEWRLAPEDKKQGSMGIVDPFTGSMLTQELIKHAERGEALYRMAMDNNIAAEQARLFLNAYGMYVVYRWSCSLQSVILFLNQRLAEDSQVEIQEYAKAVYRLAQPKFPVTFKSLIG
jgi:thymidylate synthase (FAD)